VILTFYLLNLEMSAGKSNDRGTVSKTFAREMFSSFVRYEYDTLLRFLVAIRTIYCSVHSYRQLAMFFPLLYWLPL